LERQAVQERQGLARRATAYQATVGQVTVDQAHQAAATVGYQAKAAKALADLGRSASE
jgi:hypothetical protein